MGWDESEGRFVFGNTNAGSGDKGNLTITPGTIKASLIGNATTATKIASIDNADIALKTDVATNATAIGDEATRAGLAEVANAALIAAGVDAAFAQISAATDTFSNLVIDEATRAGGC